MGAQLAAFFQEASQIGGLPARVVLARHTLMSAAQASEEKDTPALVQRFRDAIALVRAEFAGQAPAPGDLPRPATPRQAQRFAEVYRALKKDGETFLADRVATARRVTEASAQSLEIARASVWLYDAGRTAIECLDLYESAPRRHSAGARLTAKDFPSYFKALEVERAIDAEDAHTDPRTGCFSAPYLQPLGITSMLDIPIWSGGRMAGVLCQEHIGPKRRWLGEEADFGVVLAALVSQALDRRG